MPVKYITKDGVQEDRTIQTPESINAIAADSNSSYIWLLSDTRLYRADIGQVPGILSAGLKLITPVSDGVEHKFTAAFVDSDRNLWAIEGRNVVCYNLYNFNTDIVTQDSIPVSMKSIVAGSANAAVKILTITKSKTAIIGTYQDPVLSIPAKTKQIGINSSGQLYIISSMDLSINGACEDDEFQVWVSSGSYIYRYSPESWIRTKSVSIGGELWAVGFFDGNIFVYRKDNGTLYKVSNSGTIVGSVAGNGSSNFTNSDFTGYIKREITGGYYYIDNLPLTAVIDMNDDGLFDGSIIPFVEFNESENIVTEFIGSSIKMSNPSNLPIYFNSSNTQPVPTPQQIPEDLYDGVSIISDKYVMASVLKNGILSSPVEASSYLGGCIGFYPLTENTNDFSFNGNHGSASTAVFNEQGMRVIDNSCFTLLPQSIANDINIAQEATICFWQKEVSKDSGGVFGFQNIGTSDGNCHFPYSSNNMYYTSALRTNRADNFGLYDWVNRDNIWIFYAITTGPAGWIAYRNGIEINKLSFQSLNINKSTLWIGKGSYGYKDSYVKNFHIYKRQLSSYELSFIMNKGV